MKLNLARKITLLVMSVIGALVVVTGAFVSWRVRGEVARELDTQLAGAERVLAELVRSRAERMMTASASVSAAPRFRAVIEEGDASTILDTSKDEMRLVGADLVLVTDKSGKSLAAAAPMQLPARPPGVAAALAGRGTPDSWILGGKLYQVATQPINFGNEVSATLTLGQRLDDTVARSFAGLTRTGLVFFADGPLAAAFDGAPAGDIVAALAGQPDGHQLQVVLRGARYRAVVWPLFDQSGRTVARAALLLSFDEALSYLSRLQALLLGAALLVALVAFGLATWLARAITTPLSQLVESARLVGSGQYEAPVSVTTDDEVGDLARQFELMRQSLRANIEKLVEEERMRGQMEIERHRSLSTMVAGVAHEINTPLGVVNQAASILTESLTPTAIEALAKDEEAATSLADLAEAANLIQSNIARADRLIQSFKNLSVRQVTDKKESVDLPDLVSEVVGLFRISAKQARIIVEIENKLTERSWTGFPGYMSQVLMNLLTNTERYAYPDQKGGAVEVVLSPAELDGKPAYAIAVRDHGAGIAPENLSKVFEVFFTTGRGKGGSGLGLAITENLVRSALEGTIAVESTFGAGACFTVTVPRVVEGDPG